MVEMQPHQFDEQLYYNIQEQLRSAFSSDEYASLAMEPGLEVNRFYGALMRARKVLQDAINDIEPIRKGHVHEWSDNDYCCICGADGRA